MYDKVPIAKRLAQKKERNALMGSYMKLRLLLQLKAMKGEMYISLLLRVIDVAKKVFILAVELGLEVYIPSELSQKDISVSFRYYDPVLAIIHENVRQIKREDFLLINQFRIETIKRDSFIL